MPDYEVFLQEPFGLRGDWIIAELDTSISWPVTVQVEHYLGADFLLLPITRGSLPAVAYLREGMPLREAQTKVMRFLSAMSWSMASGAVVVDFTADQIPRPMQRQKRAFGGIITADLDLSYLPQPENDQGRLALALMREGRGLSHPPYSFLSLYRVLEVAIPGKARAEWMNGAIDRLSGHSAREALQKLRDSGIESIPDHIYKARRMAIAHANQQPIVDPDDAGESETIRKELPVIAALAELAIEEFLGIPSRHTEWQRHLYELAGFKAHIGEAAVAGILSGDEPDEGRMIDLPVIDIELRRRPPLTVFRSLGPVHAAQRDGQLQLIFRSADQLAEIELVLDFREERLRFNWNGGVRLADDGSQRAAEYASEVMTFLRDYLGNGQLLIFESETRKQLARVDAFIPTNFMPNHDVFNRDIEEWRLEAERRTGQRDEAVYDPPV